jgi:hypothetical protein
MRVLRNKANHYRRRGSVSKPIRKLQIVSARYLTLKALRFQVLKNYIDNKYAGQIFTLLRWYTEFTSLDVLVFVPRL